MVHWLVLDELHMNNKGIIKAWNNLFEYKKNYPDCDIKIYYRDFSMNDTIIRLECKQNYNDLDLDVNSCFNGSLRRLSQKPQDISLSQLQLDYYNNKYISA